DAVFFEALDDGERAEGGGFNERPVNFRRRGIESLAEQEPRQSLVHENGPIPVVPIQRQQPGFARLQLRRLARQGFMRTRLAAWLQVVDEPVEDVADGGLSGFETEIFRQHASIDDATKPWHVRELAIVWQDRDVARASADNLNECSGLDTRTD